MTADLVAEIRGVLAASARLPVDPFALGERSDLFVAGMSSQASVNVMLALEDHFEVEFPDEMLTREVFESIAALADAIGELRARAG
jgi:acyl carrier protein